MYGWYVNMVKAYVRYDNFLVLVWPIRHGYVMMWDECHEWLIRGENVTLCVWFGDFFIRIVCPIRRDAGFAQTTPLERPTKSRVQYTNIQ